MDHEAYEQAKQRQETLEKLFNEHHITPDEYRALGGWSAAYQEGRNVGLAYTDCPASVRRRLATDADYWQGWHDARPEAARMRQRLVEDPTREGGWCVYLSHLDTLKKPKQGQAAPLREELRKHSRMPDLRVRVVDVDSK